MDAQGTQGTQAIQRAFAVLETLALRREGMGVTELAQMLGLHKSTVHRLLHVMCEMGYVERTNEGVRYRLGLRLVDLSSQRLNQLELKTEAVPYLHELVAATGLTVHLAIRMGDEAVYIDKVERLQSLRMYSQIGRRVQLHCSSVGKVLLSGLEDNALRDVLARIPFTIHTPNTIKNTELLFHEIRRIPERGFALDREEHELGISCIGAPVYDYRSDIIAAVSLSGPTEEVCGEKLDTMVGLVCRAAKEISHRMGQPLQPVPRS